MVARELRHRENLILLGLSASRGSTLARLSPLATPLLLLDLFQVNLLADKYFLVPNYPPVVAAATSHNAKCAVNSRRRRFLAICIFVDFDAARPADKFGISQVGM